MNTSVIEIKNLKKSYGEVVVLDGIDLQVAKGTMLALLGPNGAGKTTTVRILSTLLKPDAGVATVNGFDVVRQADEVRHTIGLTGQYAALDELLTGRENLEMMGRLYHLGKAKSIERATELLKQFDLVEAAGRAVKTYSGGMRRRLDLAASLVATPPVIFLDEPTTGLDPRSRLTMWAVIEELKKKGATILLTTQYLEEADKLADKIAVLDKGKIIALGTAAELKARVGNERTEIVIERPADFDRAKALFAAANVTTDEQRRSISVPTDGSVKAVKNILDTLSAENIEIDTMSVHKPTLDDVFLQLTGHGAQTVSENENAS